MTQAGSGTQKLRIAMCCDFFYPRLGGVEMHIWSLSQCLLRMGHKVIVITHQTDGPDKRQGVRYMTNHLKVYYIPLVSMVDNVVLPTFLAGMALFRTILIRERIQIVHGHQATSAFMHECIVQAKTMGYKAIYTDHSLFGFADAASVHLNKVQCVRPHCSSTTCPRIVLLFFPRHQ
jgi:phosphatidylinositol glycan class A protein